jgi:hypothetical protein
MAIVVLGGLTASTRLNLLMLPVLALRFGKRALCPPANPPLWRHKNGAKKMRKRALRAESGMNIAEHCFVIGKTNQRAKNG